MTNNHTPLPWRVNDKGRWHDLRQKYLIEKVTGKYADVIAEINQYAPEETASADAALIVRAVNNHAALVEALRMAASEMEVAAGVAWTKADAMENLHMPAARGLRNSGDKLKDAANEIRAALALAKGEA